MLAVLIESSDFVKKVIILFTFCWGGIERFILQLSWRPPGLFFLLFRPSKSQGSFLKSSSSLHSALIFLLTQMVEKLQFFTSKLGVSASMDFKVLRLNVEVKAATFVF